MGFLLLIILLHFILPEKQDAICLSTEERKLYSLLNDYRQEKGLKPIPYSAALTRVAQAHVRDLERWYDFSPGNKCNPHSWSSNGEWRSCCYTNDHKEAACMWQKPNEISGYEDSGYEIAYYASAGATAEEGLDGWIQSPAHKPLIVNEGQWSVVEWKALGVGIYGKYAVVWFGAAEDASSMILCDQ